MPGLPKDFLKPTATATRKQLMEILKRIMDKYPGQKVLPEKALPEVSKAFSGMEAPDVMETGLLRDTTQQFRNIHRSPIEEARRKFFSNPLQYELPASTTGMTSTLRRGPLGGPQDIGYGTEFFRSRDIPVVPPSVSGAVSKFRGGQVSGEELGKLIQEAQDMWKDLNRIKLLKSVWSDIMKKNPASKNPQQWFIESYVKSKIQPEFGKSFPREKGVLDILQGQSPEKASMPNFIENLFKQKGGK